MTRKRSFEERFWEKVRISDGCWLWSGSLSSGYGALLGREGKLVRAHRSAWEFAHGPIPKGMCVCHQCDTPACVRADHMFLGTMRDNLRDCAAKGRVGTKSGEACNLAKLTNRSVRAIRAKHALRGMTIGAISREYGVHHKTISWIVRGRTWKHIDNTLTGKAKR